jgi:hypothetical protein
MVARAGRGRAAPEIVARMQDGADMPDKTLCEKPGRQIRPKNPGNSK